MSAVSDVSRSEAPPTPWWLVLIEAIGLILIGILLLLKPGMSSIVLVQVLGLYWLIAGIFKIVSIFLDSAQWGWKLFAGILGIIAGIIVIQHPLWSTAIAANTFIIVLGIFGILMGAVSIYQAFKGAGWGTGILGIVTVILGFALLANVWVLTFSLPWTLGILTIIGGVIALVQAFRLRGEEKALAAETAATRTGAAVAPAAVEKAVAEEPAAEEPVVEEPVAEEPAAEKPVVEEPVAAEAATRTEVVAAAVVEEAVAEEPVTEEAAAKAAAETDAYHSRLTYIEGVGPKYAEMMEKIGIHTPEMLLEQGATPKGRAEISEQSGISSELILTWINHADLFRIKGVGAQYADLLEAAGVDTIPSLARRNAQNLHQRLVEVNEEKKLVRHIPTESQVEDWVAQAKELPRMIHY